jgi:multicomponent Na+:H+ antiporter subunit G
MEWIRFVIAALLLCGGVIVEILAIFGVFRFRYVLNRIHSAAMGDTLGLLMISAGMCVVWGLSFTTLKIIVMLSLFWLTSPVSSHLIGRLMVETDKDIEKECEVRE